MHYIIIRGENISDWLLFRNIREVRRYLAESIHSDKLKPMLELAEETYENGDIFCSVNIDGIDWELHQSEPSEEPSELKFHYN